MNRLLLLLVAVATLTGTAALAASGIQGRAAWRGEVGAGVTVRAYRSIADIAAEKVVAVSAPTALDGTYRLELPPGSYYLTARDYAGPPQPGKLFCYYSGAPVTVRDGAFTNVGFNLIRIPQEAVPEVSASSGIKGEVTFQGEPLGRSYLYVYKEPGEGFKGPGYFIQPVEKGSFRLRLPPGKYYLLARKRNKGGQFGPIDIGDHFNYYYGNPVTVEAGKVREVKIETITRLEMLEEGEKAPFRGVRGVVQSGEGKGVAGLHVFAYTVPTMTGTPAFFSAATGVDGRFELPLNGPGPYYLLARQAFGGPAEAGELYGRFDGGGAVRFDEKNPVREVTIHVEQKRLP